MPSRLLSAFPAGTPVNRVPLDIAIARVQQRIAGEAPIEALAELAK